MEDGTNGVPAGYKQTEVGLIPSDWGVRPLGALVTITSGESPSHFRFGPVGIPYFKVEQLNNSPKYLGGEETDYFLVGSPRTIPAGSVVFPKRGASIMLNKIRLLKASGYMDTNMMALTPGGDVDSGYLFYTLSHLGLASVADVTSIPQINNKHIRPFLIPVPSLSEQCVIAETLSDVDDLIASFAALIEKKRGMKQGVMQALLTGRTRLPGFDDEWTDQTVGSVAQIVNGGTPSTRVADFWGGTIPWCTPTDITSGSGKYLSLTERSITAAGLASCGASLLPAGSLLLCSRATIGELKIATTEMATNQGFKSLVATDGVSNEFLYYLVLTLKVEMIERANGSTFLEISKRDLASIPVRMPSEDEQTAIAVVLSDIDAEIAELERRRRKTLLMRQGMMQELLTGRTRLIEPKAPAA